MHSRWNKRIGLMAASLVAGAMGWGTARAEAPVDPKIVRTWKAKCASCHGADGKGQTEQGIKSHCPDMTSAKWQSENSDEKMRNAILNGVKKADGKEGMDRYKDVLTPEQVDGLIKVVRSFGAH